MNLNDGLYIGVDGCRGGWITCVLDHGELRFERFDSIEELRAKSKEALANMPSVKAYLLAYAPSCEIDGARKVLLVMETADRSDANATVVAVACDVDKKKADDGLKLLPQTSSLFK